MCVHVFARVYMRGYGVRSVLCQYKVNCAEKRVYRSVRRIAPVDSASEATVFSHAAVSSALAAILMYNTGGQMTCVTPPHALDRLRYVRLILNSLSFI